MADSIGLTGGDGWAGGYAGWRSDVVARLQDFVQRKKGLAAQKWGKFLRGVEENLSPAQLKAALREALRGLYREDDLTEELVDAEFSRLCEAIRQHGRTTSIENYSAYLFTVETDLDDGR